MNDVTMTENKSKIMQEVAQWVLTPALDHYVHTLANGDILRQLILNWNRLEHPDLDGYEIRIEWDGARYSAISQVGTPYFFIPLPVGPCQMRCTVQALHILGLRGPLSQVLSFTQRGTFCQTSQGPLP
jgi:crotonobetainyl-CoA:carnitine CoA-transferase CaiB-like acyl-CoA transferase